MEKAHEVQEQLGNINRKMETLRKSGNEVLEIKTL